MNPFRTPGGCAAAVLSLALVTPAALGQTQTPFVSGGIGQAQAQRMLQQRDDYPLAVEIYHRQGGKQTYTAGADVRITDARGTEVLATQANGPFLFARVPPGRYTVEVSLEGRTHHKTARVAEGGTTRSIFVFGAAS